MNHQPIRNRFVALALVLAMVLAFIPAALVSTVSAESLIPESYTGRVVYVSAEGSDADTVNGGTEDPFKTLEYAMERLSAADSAADAVIVIVGTITSNKSYNILSSGAYVNTLTTDAPEAHTGTYYITGSYGEYTGGKIDFNKSSGTNYNFGGPIVIENLALEQKSTTKTLNFHTSTSLTIGDGVSVTDPEGKVSIIGGDYNSDVANTTIKISSGTWTAVRAGNNTKNITGTATVTIGGSAVVKTLAAGGNNPSNVANAVFNINAGTVNSLQFTGTKDSATSGNVTINLNAGTVDAIGKGKGAINDNSAIVVNLGENFVMGEMTLAVESALGEGNTISSTLNLGNVAEEPAEALLAEFDDANYTLPAKVLLYVDGTVETTGDGSKGSPYKTLQEAYTYIAANAAAEGGTIVICGDLTLSDTIDLESNYAITGTVEITSKVSDTESYEATITSGSSKTYFYPTASTYIHDISWDSTGKTTYFYTGENMVLGENISVLPLSGKYGLKLFTTKKTASAADKISLTVKSGLYHSIFMGGQTGSTAGNVSVTMTGGTVTTFFVLGPNSSADKPSTSGNLTAAINGGSIAQLCCTPDTGAATGDVVLNLNGGTINDMAPKGTGITMKSVTVNVASTMTSLPATLGNWSGNTVTNGTGLNILGYKGNAGISGYDVVNIKDGAEITCAAELTASNITVDASSTLILTYPTYTGADKLPEGVSITASIGGTITDSAYGKVYYAEIQYPEVVFVDGTVETSGTGLSADSPVKTLTEAYALLSPTEGGTVVLCGALDVTEATNLENISGKVIFTSVYGGVNYRKTNQAVLNFPESVRIYFGDETYIRDMNIVCGSGTVYVYCGADMTFGEGISVVQNKTFKIFTTDSSVVDSADNAKDYKLTILSGSYESVWMGGLTANAYIGDVDFTFGGNADMRLLVLGPNKGFTGDINANINGGTITKITNTGAGTGMTVGNVVLNLNNGAIKQITGYNSNVHYAESFTLNVDLATLSGLPSELGFFENMYLPGTTTNIPLTLNYLNYDSTAIPAGTYDVVNVFGGSIPAGYVSPREEGKQILAIHDYDGITSIDLSVFDKLIVTGGSDVTCAGEVPTSLVLSATDSVLRIRPSQQPAGTALADYTIVNNDVVLWEEPAYTEHDVIFGIDFENEYTASGNVTVNSTNNGYTTSFQNGGFSTGYNGNTALYIVNEFGAAAQNYLTVDLTGSGYDITTGNYTVTFWYKTENGGADQWARGVHNTTAGTDVNMPAYVMGGTIFSNQDTVQDTSGMSFLQLPRYKYVAAGITTGDGAHHDTDGIWQLQDDEWHHVAVSYDRNGSYCVYADGELITIADISAYAGTALGVNALTFGADALGQYGLGNAFIDDIVVYSDALNMVDVQAQYYTGCIDALAHQIETRMAELGSEYDSYKADMTATLNNILDQAKGLEAKDYPTLISLFRTLSSAYERFMAAPEKDALLTMLLTSDIHLGASGTSEGLSAILAQLQELGVDLDVLLSAGDFADNPTTATVSYAYEYMFQQLEKYGFGDTLFFNVLGNHDAYWKAADANYQTAIPLYWQYMMDHMEEKIADGSVTLDHASYYVDDSGIVQSCSYAVTFQGCHFLAINTDYPEGGQSGNSALILDQNGNYAIEGNEVDPIRHTMHLKDETLAWMDEVLDKWAEDGMPVFAAGHYLFADTCPLSFDSPIIINSSTIGKQDQQLRKILASHKNVFYFCGHVHASFGVIDPWLVEVEGAGSFWELNLSAIKGSAWGYLPRPSNWIMYVYEDEVVLRARDFTTGEWHPEFDEVIKLDCAHIDEDVEHISASDATCDTEGNSEYWHCTDCGKYFSNEDCTNEIEKDSWVLDATGHDLTHYEAVEPTCDTEGNIEYWRCETCGAAFADEDATLPIAKDRWILGVNHANVAHIEAVEPGCHFKGNVEYWICNDCGYVWLDENLTQVSNVNSVVLPELGGDLIHMEAVEPGCHYEGHIEHWYCNECNQVWQDEARTQLTNHQNVILPELGGELIHMEAIEPGCHYKGHIEHWYCNKCNQVWQDEAMTQLTNHQNVVLPELGGEVVHVEAKAPTCTENGNKEYWTCEDCLQVWENEALTALSNIKNVQIAATGHTLVKVEAKAATKEADGNIEYWYCSVCGKYFADAEATEEITKEETIVTFNPETGDSSIMIPAALLAMLGITGTALLIKRRQYK